jgi:hypothetical protein
VSLHIEGKLRRSRREERKRGHESVERASIEPRGVLAFGKIGGSKEGRRLPH